MKEDWSRFFEDGWRWNSAVIKNFRVPSWEFNRFRNKVKKADPGFYRENVFKDDDNRLLLSPVMIDRMKEFYPWKFKSEAITKVFENIKDGMVNGVNMDGKKDIDFSVGELESVLGLIDREIELVEVKLDALKEKEEGLKEFRDKVLFKLGR